MSKENKATDYMVEVLSLGAATALLFALATLFSSVIVLSINRYVEDFKTTRDIRLTEQILIGIYTVYKDTENYNGLSNDFLIQRRIVPKKNVREGKIINRFGGEITVETVNGSKYFSITFSNLPQRPCEYLLKQAKKSYPTLVNAYVESYESELHRILGYSKSYCGKNNKVVLVFW